MAKNEKPDFWLHLESVDFFFEVKQNITYYRKRKGLTQVELAKKAGISRSFLSHIEAPNADVRFSMETLVRICNALEITPDELIKARE